MESEQNIGIDPSILSAIRGKAAHLIGACGFSAADRADLQQELVFDCLSRLGKFDPTKSSHRTFLHRVVGHRVATLVDAKMAACRDYRLCRDSDLTACPGWANSIPPNLAIELSCIE